MTFSKVRPEFGGGFHRPLKCADFILQHLARVDDDNISNMHRLYREALKEAALLTGRLHQTGRFNENGTEILRGRPYQVPNYSSFVRTIWALAKPPGEKPIKINGVAMTEVQIEPSGRTAPASIKYLADKIYYRLATGARVPEPEPIKPARIKPTREVEVEQPSSPDEKPIRIVVEGELPLSTGRRKRRKGGVAIE